MFKLFDLYKKSFSGLSQQTWMLALVMLLNRTGAMVIPFLGVYAIRELNFTEAMVGIVLSSFGVGCVLGNYVGGKLTDNFGSYKVQLFSLILTGPIFLVISFCKDLISLSICVGILGLVAELFRPANSISITLFAKKENITRAFTLNRLALNLGFSFGPALGGFLSLFSFKWLFYGNALGISITALVFYLYFSKQSPKNTLENKTFLESEKKEGSSVWKDYKFLMFCVVNVLYALVFSQLLSILPVFYKNEIKMSEFEIGTILAYSGIFVVLTEMLFIYLTERRFSIIKNMFIGVFFFNVDLF